MCHGYLCFCVVAEEICLIQNRWLNDIWRKIQSGVSDCTYWEKNIGQNFGEFINTGEAVSLNESDDAFSFTIYEDGRITDNYPKVILGNQIKQDIYSILDHGKLEYTNVDIRFIESDQEYVTFEDYKSNHNVLIFSDLKGLETNVDKNIENAYDLLCALRDQGYYFCLTIDIDKASKTIIYDQDNEMISKDSFIQKFS